MAATSDCPVNAAKQQRMITGIENPHEATVEMTKRAENHGRERLRGWIIIVAVAIDEFWRSRGRTVLREFLLSRAEHTHAELTGYQNRRATCRMSAQRHQQLRWL